MVIVFHVTWLVNSATHMWGYRNYETTDDSRNLWWVGLLAFGEGWHNNHHAYQRMAKHGHRWWELDLTYWVIRALEAAGPGLGRGPHAAGDQAENTAVAGPMNGRVMRGAAVANFPFRSIDCGPPNPHFNNQCHPWRVDVG